MKICIVADGYPSKNVVYSAFIGVLARELAKRGNEIKVITVQSYTKHILRGKPLERKKFVDRLPTGECIEIYEPITLTFGNGRLVKMTHAFRKKVIEKALAKYALNSDLIYCHFWHNCYYAKDFAYKNNIPLVVATGEDVISINKVLTDVQLQEIREVVKGVVCVSTKNKEESIRTNLAYADKCKVIPNAIDCTEFYKMDKDVCRKKLGIKSDAFVVAFCGRFNHRKGAFRVSEAIKKCKDESIFSIFIGSDVEQSNLHIDCSNIIFKGCLKHENIPLYLNCADVFVLPSLAEGCPNSVIEAMGCGLPIVSSDLLFNSDILDSKNSILVDPNNIDQISDAIMKLKSNPVLRDNMAKDSLEKAKNLTIEKRIDRIMEFINEVLA